MNLQQQQAIAMARARSRAMLSGATHQAATTPPNAFDSAVPGDYSMGQRAAMSVKMTPQGKAGYMEAQPDVLGTVRDARGNLYAFEPDGIKRVDPAGFDMGDIADMAGPALEAAPAVGAGMVTANPFAVGAGAAAGNALRQGASAMLPGDEGLTMQDRAKMVGAMGLTGAGSQVAGNALMRGVDAMRPRNLYFGRMRKRADENVINDSRMIETETGLSMSAGQYFGDSGLLQIEGLLRQHPMTIYKVAKFDEKQLEQSVMHLESVLQGLSKKGASPATLGDNINTATRQLVGKVVERRRVQGVEDFKRVEALGGTVPIGNAARTIDEIIEQFDVPGGGDATASLVNRLKRVRSELAESEDGISPTKLNRLMQVYGSASRGQGSLFKDIHNAQQRMVAGRVVKALEDDLEAAVSNAGEGAGAKALILARDNYKADSEIISRIENTVIGRIIGGDVKSPESITARLMQMNPSELKQSMNLLKNTDNPGLIQDIKRRYVEEMMEGSIKGATHQRATGSLTAPEAGEAGTINFSPDKMLGMLTKPKAQAQMKAIFDEKELREINLTTEMLRRLSNRAGTGGSQTGPLLFASDMIRTIASPNPAHVIRGAATMVGPGKMVGMLMDPQARRSLMTLKRSKTWTRGAAGAATYLFTTYGTDVLEPVREPVTSGGQMSRPRRNAERMSASPQKPAVQRQTASPGKTTTKPKATSNANTGPSRKVQAAPPKPKRRQPKKVTRRRDTNPDSDWDYNTADDDGDE